MHREAGEQVYWPLLEMGWGKTQDFEQCQTEMETEKLLPGKQE